MKGYYFPLIQTWLKEKLRQRQGRREREIRAGQVRAYFLCLCCDGDWVTADSLFISCVCLLQLTFYVQTHRNVPRHIHTGGTNLTFFEEDVPFFFFHVLFLLHHCESENIKMSASGQVLTDDEPKHHSLIVDSIISCENALQEWLCSYVFYIKAIYFWT